MRAGFVLRRFFFVGTLLCAAGAFGGQVGVLPNMVGSMIAGLPSPNENSMQPPKPERLSTGADVFWYQASEAGNTGVCVVVCPGGGYAQTCVTYEGWAIAEWFNSIGVSAAVLVYHTTHGTPHHDAPLGEVPLRDVQETIRTIRKRAGAYRMDPKKVGVMGFSAGGHLAAMAMTQFSDVTRPDFGILCYAVTDFDEDNRSVGASQENLLGMKASKDEIRRFSPARNVTKDSPPAFIFSTDSDERVLSEQSVGYYLACRRAGVPAELHVWRNGAHGGGLCRDRFGEDHWPKLCEIWLKNMGFAKQEGGNRD